MKRLAVVIATASAIIAGAVWANISGTVSPGGKPTIDTTNSLSTGLIRYAFDTGGGSYWEAITQAPLLNPTTVGGAAVTYPLATTQWGKFLQWSGAAFNLGQYGQWLDVDTGGQSNPIYVASNLTGQPAGAGMTIAAGFVITTANASTGPDFIFARYLNPDAETIAAGFVLQSNTLNVQAYYANATPGNQDSVASTQIGNTVTITPNVFHVAALVLQNTSSSPNSTNGTFYIDGVAQGTITGINAASPCATGCGGVLNTTESQLQVGGGYHTGGLTAAWDFMNGYVPFGAMWNIPLTAAQVASISANPYQVIKSTSTGGASVSLSVVVSPTSVVSTGITCPLSTYVAPLAAGSTICTITVSPSNWSGSLALSGTDASDFAINGGKLVVGSTSLPVGTYPTTFTATP